MTQREATRIRRTIRRHQLREMVPMRAPQSDIDRLKAQMGWSTSPWYTLTDDFDTDFGVDEWHATMAFIRDGKRVFLTYSNNGGRGDEQMGNTWNYLDITALGRQEAWEDFTRAIRRPRHMAGGSGMTPRGMLIETERVAMPAAVAETFRHRIDT